MDTDVDAVEMYVFPRVQCPECGVWADWLLISTEPKMGMDGGLLGLATVGRIPICGHRVEVPLPPEVLAHAMNTADQISAELFAEGDAEALFDEVMGYEDDEEE